MVAESDWIDGKPDDNGRWLPGDREWAELESKQAPHETSGVLRMHRHGMAPATIKRVLKLPDGPTLMNEMQRGIDRESAASHAGQTIHDESLKKGTT